jgi:hypothetical protein
MHEKMLCTDTDARLDGDEFLGIRGRIAAPQDMGTVYQNILALLSEPLHI